MRIPFRNPLVVGYKGEIGSFLLQGLLKIMPKASNIWCYDINDTETERVKRIKAADYIFLCVPLADSCTFFTEYAKYLKGKVIIEQTSIKRWRFSFDLCELVKKYKFQILHMHLLFRPSKTIPADRRCAFVVDSRLHCLWSGPLLETVQAMTEAKPLWYHSLDAHDGDMSKHQALVHRVLLQLCDTLEATPKTYISGEVIKLADRIREMDGNLFSQIQSNLQAKDLLSFCQNLKAAPRI